jgi:hypothetical protein
VQTPPSQPVHTLPSEPPVHTTPPVYTQPSEPVHTTPPTSPRVPPQVTVAQTQPLPGVSPWNDGQQYVKTEVTPLAKAQRNLTPWILGGVAAVLAARGGIAAWVWRHPRGAAHAQTVPIPTASEPTYWMYQPPHGK